MAAMVLKKALMFFRAGAEETGQLNVFRVYSHK
jgi:hypothetical protein